MSITLVPTVGTTMNTYATRAEYIAYASYYPWAPTLTTDQMDVLLAYVARRMNDLPWEGDVVDETFPMAHPRANVPDPKSAVCPAPLLDSAVVQQAVKDGQCEGVLYFGNFTSDPNAPDDLAGLEQITLGPLTLRSTNTRNDAGLEDPTLSDLPQAMLNKLDGYLDIAAEMPRGYSRLVRV